MWTIALLSIIASPYSTAAEPSAQPKINWQLLQMEQLEYGDEFIARNEPGSFPFSHDFTFDSKLFRLEQDQTVFVELPANHWFYLEFSNEDTQQTLPLSGKVSQSPGLARKQLWSAPQNFLQPANSNRIIQISNPNNEPAEFYLAMGVSIAHSEFAPLSWLNQTDRQRTRLYTSHRQHQDFQSATQPLEFELEKDKIYWLEGVQKTGEPWRQTLSQMWTWQQPGDANESINTQFLFPRSSRKQLITEGSLSAALRDKKPARLKAMRSGLMLARNSGKTRLLIDKAGFVRIQNPEQDWLFNSNYQRYAKPGITGRLQRENLSQQLHQGVVETASDKDSPKTSIVKTSRGIHDLTTASTLNRWLSWNTLSPETSTGITQQMLNSTTLRWNTSVDNQPDLSMDNISLPDLNRKQRFSSLTPEENLLWYRSEDTANNQIQLQIIPKAGTHAAGTYLLKVDGEVFAQFERFNPDALQHLVKETNWQFRNTQNAIDETQGHTNNLVAGSEVITLPANWQRLELLAKNSSAMVRIRYRKLRYPKLEAAHWHSWLNYENAITPLIESANNNVHFQVEPTLANHPHWLSFQHYLQIKQAQFITDSASSFWQTVIKTGKSSMELFDDTFPDGMPGYQNLQNNLLTPRVGDWRYWQQTLAELRRLGWPGYANDLAMALVRFHPDTEIVIQATGELFSRLRLEQNYSQQVSLLSYVILTRPLTSDVTDQLILSLAELFKQQNRRDYALFMLGFAASSEARQQLARQLLLKEGYVSLAEQFPAKESVNPELLRNQQQDLAFDSLKGIKAAKRIQLYNPELNVRQSNLLLTADKPVAITVSAGTELEVEARLWFPNDSEAIVNQHNWLELRFTPETTEKTNTNSKENPIPASQLLPLFYSDYRSETLLHPDASIGAAHRFRVSLPTAGTLTLGSEKHDISINVKEVSSHSLFSAEQSVCERSNTWLAKDYDNWFGPRAKDGQKKASQESQNLKSSQFACTLPRLTKPNPDLFRLVQAGTAKKTETEALAYQDFLQRLKGFEQAPDNETLTVLNQRLESWPPSSHKHRLQQRLNQNTRWLAQNNPMRVSRFAVYNANTNSPLTPAGYRGRLLYAPFKPEWEKLSDDSALNYDLAIAKDQQYRLKLLSQKHLFVTQNSAQVNISINGELHRSITLSMGEETALDLPFSVGSQNLSVELNSARGQVSVLAQLQFRNAISNTREDDWQAQPQNVRLKLFMANKAQPFQQFFPEPSWLRIDSFTKQGIAKQTFIHAEKGIFSWYPTRPDNNVIGYRLYRLQLSTKEQEKELTAAATSQTSSETEHALETSSLFPSFELLPAQPDKEQQRYVSRPWGVELSQEQRRTPVEDQAQNNRFWQLLAYSQSSDAHRRFFSRYDMATRIYDSDLAESVHGSYQWWDTSWWRNWDLNAGFRFAAQNGFRNEGLAWSGRLHLQTQWQYSLNRRWFNRISARLWGNLINSGKDTQQFATAVYSQYKLDHRYGIQLSDAIRYKWHHDLESWAQFTLNSNPLSQGNFLDNGIVVLGSRVFYKGLAADVRWRYQTFRADRNRARNSKDARLSLALDWFGWQQDSHYRIRLGYDRNLTADENYWSLRFSWNFSGARGVRDYQPQSLSFAGLRQQQYNNQVLDFEGDATSWH